MTIVAKEPTEIVVVPEEMTAAWNAAVKAYQVSAQATKAAALAAVAATEAHAKWQKSLANLAEYLVKYCPAE